MPEVADWLARLGAAEYAERFAAEKVDYEALRHLTEGDLRELGLPIGIRRKMLVAIADMRLIGSIRRECLDHIVVFGEAHLRRILAAYAVYYNELRTHLSLGKDSPCRRPVQRLGQLASQPILGGLHHQYCRI